MNSVAELGIDVSPQAVRITHNALTTGRTSFADLDILRSEDIATQERLWAVRNELEALAALPYTTDLGERFMALVEEWLNTDPAGMIEFLDTVSADELRQ
jgi:hypothetical protein